MRKVWEHVKWTEDENSWVPSYIYMCSKLDSEYLTSFYNTYSFTHRQVIMTFLKTVFYSVVVALLLFFLFVFFVR